MGYSSTNHGMLADVQMVNGALTPTGWLYTESQGSPASHWGSPRTDLTADWSARVAAAPDSATLSAFAAWVVASQPQGSSDFWDWAPTIASAQQVDAIYLSCRGYPRP